MLDLCKVSKLADTKCLQACTLEKFILDGMPEYTLNKINHKEGWMVSASTLANVTTACDATIVKWNVGAQQP